MSEELFSESFDPSQIASERLIYKMAMESLQVKIEERDRAAQSQFEEIRRLRAEVENLTQSLRNIRVLKS